MIERRFKYVYGPVPSRRLGRSLGIDLVPFKTCTYDCVYCQLGRTTNKTMERKEYIAVPAILSELERKLSEGDVPDVISLSGSGEPTLNAALGDVIAGIKKMTKIPVAVLTNGSLLWMPEVRDALMEADLVLPSLDAGDEFMFQYVNRPHEDLSLKRIAGGLVEFTARFPREVRLEVMLLAGATGVLSEVKKIATLAGRIAPARIQLNTPCRPAAEDFAMPLSIPQLRALKEALPGNVEIIAEYGWAHLISASGKNGEADLLGLIGRRPCTLEDVADGLGLHLNEALKELDRLTALGEIERILTSSGCYYAITRNEKS